MMKTTRLASMFKCALLLSSFLLTAPLAYAIRPVSQETIDIETYKNAALAPEVRAKALLGLMTMDEKFTMVFGQYATVAAWKNFKPDPKVLPYSAGYVPAIERLGIPAQFQTDAGIGVATQGGAPKPRERTALPSGMLTASTFDRDIAFKGGAMIGREAYLSGFNILLAGGVNLVREPRNGRNFEYGGEDPLLAGIMVGEQIRGIQSNPIISTLKHFAYNNQETNRFGVNVVVDEKSGRMSELLAFQIANEIGKPWSVMCAYNRVNGAYACENNYLLNEVLKGDFGFKGYVMSDWGATHSTIPAANFGLDQQSGWPFDKSAYFSDALKEAVESNHVPKARLDNMVLRILTAMFAQKLFDQPVSGDQAEKIPVEAHEAVTQADAEAGIILLKNERNLLPLSSKAKTILIIGGRADQGVLSGGGSSQVYPRGGQVVHDEAPKAWPGPVVYFPDSPMKALQARTKAKISYLDGKDLGLVKDQAKKADLVIVFATQWLGESIDAEGLDLPNKQNQLIDEAASANPNTVVVLQTGGPVFMPWLPKVGAVLEAWYPGTRGGTAIALILTGEVNPSGHLPVTFPKSLDQLPRLKIDGGTDKAFEGSNIGYRWYEAKGHQPLFAFGHGLSYATFKLGELKIASPDPKAITVTARIHNSSKRSGAEVAQIYVSHDSFDSPKRLAGFTKAYVEAGESKTVTVSLDPRLLASYDVSAKKWIIAKGSYKIHLAASSAEISQTVTIELPETVLGYK